MNRAFSVFVLSLLSLTTVSSVEAASLKNAAPVKYDAACMVFTVPATVNVGSDYLVQARMKNTGKLTWTKNIFSLDVTSSNGNVKNGFIKRNVQPNSQENFSVTMRAPTKAGTYTVEARMGNGSAPFGKTCSAKITVKEATVKSSSSKSSTASSVQQSSTQQSSTQTSLTQSVQTSSATSVSLDIGMIDGSNYYPTVVKNEKNVNVIRFPLRAWNADIALTRATFIATSGSLFNATNYKLWADVNRDGVGDTIINATTTIQGNKITFNLTDTFVIPEFKELKHLLVLEVHADIVNSLVNDKITLELATASDFDAENLKNGSDAFVNISLKAGAPVMIADQGDLFMTKGVTAQQSLQLKSGVLADPVLTLTLKAVNEPVDVTFLPIATTHSQSIDRLDLFEVGATTPFAVATPSGCAQAGVPANTFCVSMHERQLVVQEGTDKTIVIRPRMKTTATGLVNGAKVIFSINGGVLARGMLSSRDILQNDSDTKAEGEIFVGTGTPTSNASIQSAEYTVGAVTGNLYVTQASVLAPHQLLGGTLGESILSLKLRAENEAVDVKFLHFVSTHSQSIDRLELYLAGSPTPFAIATLSCGTASVPDNAFCVSMTSQQLVIASDAEKTISVRPRMKADTFGATAGAKITLSLGSYAYARGVQSDADLLQNDGDNVAKGEVFLGTTTPASNAPITGVENTVVFSKITSIANGGPATGTIQEGVQQIGAFTFAAAANTNTLNGVNRATLNDIIFIVTLQNVMAGGYDFKIYNTADATKKATCALVGFSGNPMIGAPTMMVGGGAFVRCMNLRTSDVNTSIDAGSQMTLALEANIIDADEGTPYPSKIQTVLQRFNDPTFIDKMMPAGRNLEWIDEDTTQTTHRWIEMSVPTPNSAISSTLYE